MHYYVVTGGPLTDKAFDVIKGGKVIAADRGIDFCRKHGIVPDLAAGDMDSVTNAGLKFLKEHDIPVKTFPVEKDMTDTELSVAMVPSKSRITVVCPLNGRIDHVIANLQLAASLHAKGRDIVLDDGVTEVFFLSGNETVNVKLDRWGDDSAVSLIPLSFGNNVEGVTTKGLYYPLNDGTIECGKTLSFSNKPEKGVSRFSATIKSGILAVVITKAV